MFFELLLLAILRKIFKQNFRIALCFKEVVAGGLINGRGLKIVLHITFQV